MSRRPVIGICASVERARWTYWDEEAAVLSMNYVRQVQEAGGVAVLLAPDPHPAWFAEWEALVEWCDTTPLGGRDLQEF